MGKSIKTLWEILRNAVKILVEMVEIKTFSANVNFNHFGEIANFKCKQIKTGTILSLIKVNILE